MEVRQVMIGVLAVFVVAAIVIFFKKKKGSGTGGSATPGTATSAKGTTKASHSILWYLALLSLVCLISTCSGVFTNGAMNDMRPRTTNTAVQAKVANKVDTENVRVIASRTVTVAQGEISEPFDIDGRPFKVYSNKGRALIRVNDFISEHVSEEVVWYENFGVDEEKTEGKHKPKGTFTLLWVKGLSPSGAEIKIEIVEPINNSQ